MSTPNSFIDESVMAPAGEPIEYDKANFGSPAAAGLVVQEISREAFEAFLKEYRAAQNKGE